jgi:antitoxin ParD1/3/4
MPESSTNKHWVETDGTARQRIEQARALKERAKQSGLKFEVYLPSGLAEWVLQMVEDGVFIDPCEAVFVLMQQAKELEPHADLKQEILRRSLSKAEKEYENGNFYTMEEVREHLDEIIRGETPPVTWKKIEQPDP